MGITLGQTVRIVDSRFPLTFPNGSICEVWDVDRRKGALYPIGVILLSDESEDPKVAWITEESVEEVK